MKITDEQEKRLKIIDSQIKGSLDDAELHAKFAMLQAAQEADMKAKISMYYMNAIKAYKEKCRIYEEILSGDKSNNRQH